MPSYEFAEKTLIHELVANVESYIRVTARKTSISALWDEAPPAEAGNESLHSYLKDVYHRNFPGRAFD